MKILVLGANGFIGSHLAGMAASNGYEVFAGIRKKGNTENLKDQKGIRQVELDFSRPPAIVSDLRAYAPFDAVVSCIGAKLGKRERLDAVNQGVTATILAALEKLFPNHPPHFLFISSLASMGPGTPGTLLPVRAADLPAPVTAYGKSKWLGEQEVRRSSLPFTILKPTAVYGPKDIDFLQIFRLARYGLEVCFNREPQYTSLIHVNDLCRAVLMALRLEPARKEYLISDGQAYSFEEIYRVLRQLFNRRKGIRISLPEQLDPLITTLSGIFPAPSGSITRDKLIELRQRNWLCDSAETFRALNFEPEFDLVSGFSDTMLWYRNHRLI